MSDQDDWEFSGADDAKAEIRAAQSTKSLEVATRLESPNRFSSHQYRSCTVQARRLLARLQEVRRQESALSVVAA